jgi:putative transposase
MYLTEQHLIKQNNNLFKECDNLCLKSKNLYNSCLYIIRQAYIKDKTNLIFNLHHLMKETTQYRDLPAKVSSHVLLMVQQNFKSYFKTTAEYYKNPSKFKSRPKLPSYLDTNGGRFIISYTNQALSKKVFKKTGKIKLSLSNIEINTRIKDFNSLDCVRIIPRNNYYVIEVVYTIIEKEKLKDNNNYLSLDIGVNNLATLTSNVISPLIINGKPLKSMNQFYNKKMAETKSILEKRNNKKSSKRINNLNLKRKNKIDNYLHKSSKEIIKICKNNKINTIIIGKNDGWKQNVSMAKRSNQNFVNIPHSRFVEMIKYKCEIEGINIIIQEESYTSKASFLDLDFIPIYGKEPLIFNFSGKRIKTWII